MKLTHLKYFQTICKYNNLTRAAEELHVSQPGLTQVIHELEQEFGLTLFLRQSKGLALTEEGKQFLDETNLLLEQADTFVRRMKHLGQSNQTIRIGLPPASTTLFFSPVMQVFHERYPHIKVNVTENGSVKNRQQILDGKLDLAFLSSNSSVSSAFGSHKIATAKICLYLSTKHPLSKKTSVSLRDIESLPLVLLSEDSFLTTYTLKTCMQYKVIPNIILSTNQIALIKQFIENNTSGTILFHGTIPNKELYTAIPIDEFEDINIFLIWNQHNTLSTATRSFIKTAQAIYPTPLFDSYCNDNDNISPIPIH